jgi:hypothetical protein
VARADDVAGAVLRDALGHLPEGEYRRYCHWLLDQPQYRGRWLQVLGVPSLIGLARWLLVGLVTDAARELLIAEHGPPLFGYLIWEATSDNLAIGLGHRMPSDDTYVERAALMRTFNDAMLARLAGDRAEAPGSDRISLARQSLSEKEHRALLAAYLDAVPGADAHEIEFAAGPALAANIAAAEHAVHAMRDRAAGPLFRSGLLRRYHAVNTLLTGAITGPGALRTGTDAILVAPTLAYLISMLAEIIDPIDRFPAVASTLLADTLHEAGLLVRLLNDCGTGLLEQSADEREELLRALRGASGATLADVLLVVAADQPSGALTRLVKDLTFGEFNICLDGLHDLPATEGIGKFGGRLELVCAAYLRARSSLRAGVGALRLELGSPVPGQIVERFVAFHRRMYAAAFDSMAGDYAIGSEQGRELGGKRDV